MLQKFHPNPGVSAGVKLTHPVDRKLTHLNYGEHLFAMLTKKIQVGIDVLYRQGERVVALDRG
jgi:hypothetical protein